MCPGRYHCIDLYNSDTPLPEIHKTDLLITILQLSKLNYNLKKYNEYLPDMIEKEILTKAYNDLLEMDSIDEHYYLTQVGQDQI